MIPLDETFDGTFPFAPHTFDGHGFVQHYVDEGPRDGEVIVCLHGEPTWGYLYRNMIGPLSRDHRVIVPDHMGFGKSATPQDRPYTLQQHTENLTALLEHLGVSDITLVAQDWVGPIASAYTVRNGDRVKRLFLANTLAGYGQVDDPDIPQIIESPWFRWIGEGLETGRTEQVLRHAGSTILSVMKIIGFQNSAAVDDTWIRAYSAQFPDWDSAIGAYEFPIDAYQGRIFDYVMAGLDGVPDLVAKPAILLEGLEDRAIPPARAIADFRALWPDAPVVELPGVGHFCQEDAPEILVTNILQFMAANP
ncbi:MAG: alpha/beta fold hydrolase [Acidimicrobiales bacterium]